MSSLKQICTNRSTFYALVIYEKKKEYLNSSDEYLYFECSLMVFDLSNLEKINLNTKIYIMEKYNQFTKIFLAAYEIARQR